jgi:outer membrane lipoprotein-sorting protein
MRRWFTATVLALALSASAVFAPSEHNRAEAAIAPQLNLGTAEQAELTRIEQYVNSVRSLQSSFFQQSSNGESARGKLFLRRPGKLRIEYDPPVPVLVVADGTFLIYYDRKLEQVSYIPLSSTPASILLDKHISLLHDALTITAFERDEHRILVSLIRTEHPGEGSITFVFQSDPLELRQWYVTDPQGIVTQVSLIDPQFGIDLDRSLFVFVDPRPKERDAP